MPEVYGAGNFEDVEYCVRATVLGYICIYEPKAELYHYGSGSDNTATINRNYQIFRLRNEKFATYDDWRIY
jgi:GT2 family glycosyltransferase